MSELQDRIVSILRKMKKARFEVYTLEEIEEMYRELRDAITELREQVPTVEGMRESAEKIMHGIHEILDIVIESVDKGWLREDAPMPDRLLLQAKLYELKFEVFCWVRGINFRKDVREKVVSGKFTFEDLQQSAREIIEEVRSRDLLGTLKNMPYEFCDYLAMLSVALQYLAETGSGNKRDILKLWEEVTDALLALRLAHIRRKII